MTASSNERQFYQWKLRGSPAGLHLFNQVTGLNVLLDEVSVPNCLYSRAPRQVSVALTNRCDLACAYCYAPKSRARLQLDVVKRWLTELDSNGTLGVGFGGGEPTLYPGFDKLCQYLARETQLAVSFTTHGHHIDRVLAERLYGSINFVRVSMDGVGVTYEAMRRRPFGELLTRLENVRWLSPFGINVVINERTLPELDEVAIVAADVGACELLLLPQVHLSGVVALPSATLLGLRRWVDSYSGPLSLCMSQLSAEGFPTHDPLAREDGLLAYAHIDAQGVLKPTSYSDSGVHLSDGNVLQALDQLSRDLGEADT